MRKDRHHLIAIYAAAMMFAGSCTNNPYRPGENAEFTFFGPFSTPPTKLDPASAYYVHEGQIIDQIYEPPFTYHYLKRPYELIPLTAECIPEPEYFDNHGKRIHDADPDPNIVVRTEYTIKIKKGIMYQNHPCFALNDSGAAYYENIGSNLREKHNNLADFEHQSTRELLARDYVLQIRRLADPRLASPVFSTIARYVLGLEQLHDLYAEMLARERERRRTEAGSSYNQERDEKENPIVLDYMKPDLPGVMIINSHTYKIILMRKYPQILYWMCMHFFGPMPEEAIKFYALPTIAKQEFSINKSPVGTGPYYLKVFKPNEKIVLEKNPNYHDDFYPTDGAPGDEEKGLLRDAGKRIPFIHRQVLRLEKEAMPTWSKFLQGYYDSSSIANDVFDQAVQLKSDNDPDVSPMMSAKGIRLITDVDTMFWYTAFNMLDPIVGGYEPGKAQLRQAISIALDYNEYLDIFANGRGVLAQGPIPPGIFGYRSGSKGANPFVDEWDLIRKRHVRQSIEKAQQLMKAAGYTGGIGSDGQPLTLHYDHSAQGSASFRSYFDWQKRRLALLGIRLKDRGTDLSRYRQKTQSGNWQIASSGWLADYPDAENFLFLFYGPNSKVATGGANATNYQNEEYDNLFIKMESMQNSEKRQKIIDQMIHILQRDAPAVWQYHPISYVLRHAWYTNNKPHQMSYNTMKFKRLDPDLRVKKQKEWNKPVWWPIALIVALLAMGSIPAVITAYRRERYGV